MSARRLTIMVPTFNRAGHLRRLLEVLCTETDGLGDRVGVLVADNASTDDTPTVLAEMASRMPGLKAWRNEANLGPDENFCRCVEADTADYFWLFGDDDLPRAGLVAFVLDLLDQQAPDLVHLQHECRVDVVDNDPHDPVPADTPTVTLGQRAFARRLHIWTTYISGLVVRRATYVSGRGAGRLREYTQTNLVQLGWVLGTLERATKLVHVPARCVITAAGNTGGYKVLRVFGVHFPRVVNASLGAGSPLARVMVRRCAYVYLPALAWNLRCGTAGLFARENPLSTLDPRLIGVGAYCLVSAITLAPMRVARLAVFLARLPAGLLRRHDQLLERRDAGLTRQP